MKLQACAFNQRLKDMEHQRTASRPQVVEEDMEDRIAKAAVRDKVGDPFVVATGTSVTFRDTVGTCSPFRLLDLRTGVAQENYGDRQRAAEKGYF